MSKVRLGELLINEGKIDETQLQSALGFQKRWGKKIGESLIQLGFLTELDLVQTLARVLKVPLIDLSKLDTGKITRAVLSQVTLQSARTHRVVPLAIKEIRGRKRLVVAMSDPTNFRVIDELQFKSGLPVLAMVTPDSDIEWFIRKFYLGDDGALSLNFVSGISPIEGEADDRLQIDPVSSIFFDAEFTGMSKIGTNATSSKKNKT